MVNIVLLGAGRVNRAFAAWFASQNAQRSSGLLASVGVRSPSAADPIRVQFVTRDDSGGPRELLEEAPWLLEMKKRGAQQNNISFRSCRELSSSPRPQPTTNSSSQNGTSSGALFDIEEADAIVCATPLSHAVDHLYLFAELLERAGSSTPIFLMSRGVAMAEGGPRSSKRLRDIAAPAIAQVGVTTSARPTSADGVDTSGAAADTQPRRRLPDGVTCAAAAAVASVAEALPAAIRERIVPLGGLVSHRVLLDAAAMRAGVFLAHLSEEDNAKCFQAAGGNDDAAGGRHQSVYARRRELRDVFALSRPPTLLLAACQNEQVLKCAAQVLGRLNLSGVTMRHASSSGDTGDDFHQLFVRHALLDSLLIPAAFGGGLIRGHCGVVAGNAASSSSSTASGGSTTSLVHAAHGAFLRSLLCAASCSLPMNDNSDNSLIDAAVAQCASLSAGLGAAANAAELGRRLAVDHSLAAEAELALFRPGSGHGEALHKTLEAFASLEQQQQQQKPTSVFTTLDHLRSGFLSTSEGVARLFEREEGSNGAAAAAPLIASEMLSLSDGDGESDAAALFAHPLMEDLRRVDQALQEGVVNVENPAEMARLLKNVTPTKI